ncbi:MAG: hypothetical protein ACKOAW_03500 [Actinomycetota bacterium]
MPAFPRRIPDTLDAVADPIIDILGPLVPEQDAQRARAALSQIDMLGAVSVGLEVVLPPHPPACDVSVLMPAKRNPAFAANAHRSLARLAELGGETESTWWELDTSTDDLAVGAFVRCIEGDAFPWAREAAADRAGLLRAVDVLAEFVGPHWFGMGRLVGFFPDRQPEPVAAALLPGFYREFAPTFRDLTERATVAVDPDAALIAHLSAHVNEQAISVGADAAGRTAVSWEGCFLERERAMADDRWSAPLQPTAAWGDAGPSLARLLAVQGVHTYDSLPTVRLLSGIDHIKIGPGGKVKAYVGAHIVSTSYL